MRRVYLTTSITTGDQYPEYDFGVYEDDGEMVCINLHKPDPHTLDMLNEREQNEYLRKFRRSSYDD